MEEMNWFGLLGRKPITHYSVIWRVKLFNEGGNKQSIQFIIPFIKQKKINFLFFDFIPFNSWIEWDGIEEKYYNSNS